MNKAGWIFFLLIGIVGAAITCYGLFQPPAHFYYTIGGLLMLATAVYFKLTYFVALELILVAGDSAVLLGIGPVLQIVLPVLLSAQLLIYYLLLGQLNSPYRVIGIVGIALLSIAFSYNNQWIFLLGGLAVAIFASYQVHRQRYVALLWVFLSLTFMLIAIYKLIV